MTPVLSCPLSNLAFAAQLVIGDWPVAAAGGTGTGKNRGTKHTTHAQRPPLPRAHASSTSHTCNLSPCHTITAQFHHELYITAASNSGNRSNKQPSTYQSRQHRCPQTRTSTTHVTVARRRSRIEVVQMQMNITVTFLLSLKPPPRSFLPSPPPL